MIVRLETQIQSYEWGQAGDSSLVGRLYAQCRGVVVDPETRYAELWLGTHPKGCACVAGGDGAQALPEYILASPGCLGPALSSWGCTRSGRLPFLFKVLSISKALSIQAHPTRELGARLHARDPAHYPDPLHKPEMVIAMADFEALCGFRPLAAISASLARHAELRGLCGGRAAVADAPALRAAFEALLRSPPAAVADALEALRRRRAAADDDETTRLCLELAADFPGDVGCFVAFFLNHLRLRPGEALFLGPNEPHAYLRGNCLECMAASDNTIRAGLTPKFRDVDTLVGMLSYRCGAPDRVEPRALDDDGLTRYRPPVADFCVWRVATAESRVVRLPEPGRAYLLLIVAGRAVATAAGSDFEAFDPVELAPGAAFFVPASLEALELSAVDSEVEFYLSSVNAAGDADAGEGRGAEEE